MENEEKVVKNDATPKEKNNIYYTMTIIALVSSIISIVLSTVLISICLSKPNLKNNKNSNAKNKTQVETSVDDKTNKSSTKHNTRSHSEMRNHFDCDECMECPNSCQGRMCPGEGMGNGMFSNRRHSQDFQNEQWSHDFPPSGGMNRHFGQGNEGMNGDNNRSDRNSSNRNSNRQNSNRDNREEQNNDNNRNNFPTPPAEKNNINADVPNPMQIEPNKN